MKTNNKNRGWCEDEDKLIGDLVQKYGTKNWAKVAEQLHLVYGYRKKSGKQCRQRWHNHLDPNITKKSWSSNEENIMFEQHKKHGNKWTIIAQKLPGRTDNAIKNHFYSTIRRSLRRISKFMGSKNSTIQLRKIKPSTLSKVFKLAQGKSNQEATNSERDSKQNSHEMQCKQIINCLMQFSKKKLCESKKSIDNEDEKKIKKILQQMVKINDIYQNEKLVQAKLKKQKLLQKNFDDAAQSQSDQEQQYSQYQKIEQFQPLEPRQQQLNENQMTRSNRKIKPPNIYHKDCLNQKNQKRQTKLKFYAIQQTKQKYIKQQQNIISAMKNIMSPLRKIEQQNYMQNNEQMNKYGEIGINISVPQNTQFQFECLLQEQNFMQLENNSVSLIASPGISNTTPFPLTPRRYQFIETNHNHQMINNQDCNQIVNKLINQISRNTGGEYPISRGRTAFQSPSSAFNAFNKYQ